MVDSPARQEEPVIVVGVEAFIEAPTHVIPPKRPFATIRRAVELALCVVVQGALAHIAVTRRSPETVMTLTVAVLPRFIPEVGR